MLFFNYTENETLNDVLEVTKLRNQLYVERLAGRNPFRSYNLVEHSYFVGILFEKFLKKRGTPFSSEDLMLAFTHDFLEVITGDLIALSKNLNEKTKEAWSVIEEEVAENHNIFKRYTDSQIKASLGEEKANILRNCDLLELWIFCTEEAHGYQNLSPDIISVVEDMEYLLLREENIMRHEMTDFMDVYRRSIIHGVSNL